MKKPPNEPQWGRVTPLMLAEGNEPVSIVALDPAGSTGFAVRHMDEGEHGWYWGQADIDEWEDWVLPLVEGRQCLVAIERGYIAQLGRGASYQQRMASEANTILLMQRIGRSIEQAKRLFISAGPIWTPNAQMWRGKFKGWVGTVKGRENHKLKAQAIAKKLTGDELTPLPHYYRRGRIVGKSAASVYEDAADAICIGEAAWRHFEQGKWPLWRDL